MPTRAYADLWPEAISQYFTEYRNAYRQRLSTFWPQELESWRDEFVLVSPVEAVIIGTLAASWIFARPATIDNVRVVESWEHGTLADWGLLKVPRQHRVEAVAQEFLDGVGWMFLEEQVLAGELTIVDMPAYYRTREFADHDADLQAQQARELALHKDGVIDLALLAQVRVDLEELEASEHPQRRGTKFEEVMERLLIANGCAVERGRLGNSEQVDLFMVDPQLALIECRWERKPLEPKAISVLMGKLRKRPAAVAGIYVSMSGFTDGAQASARDEHDRTIILLNKGDVLDLAAGRIKFRTFWRARMRDLIVRYR